jgi:Ca-activated chloride channel homolog
MIYYFIILMLCIPKFSAAMNLTDFWWRGDVQAKHLYDQHHYQRAAQQFKNPAWRGIAHYRAKQYHQAAQAFAHDPSARGHYNRGNALAQLQQYQAASQAYEKAITLDKSFQDAQYNLALIKKLLKQQKQKNEGDRKNQKNTQTKQKKQQGKEPQDKTKQNKGQPNNTQEKPKNKQENKPKNKKNSQEKDSKIKKQAATEQKKLKANDSDHEQAQADKQWLRRLADEPGSLLKQKFLRDYQRHQGKL